MLNQQKSQASTRVADREDNLARPYQVIIKKAWPLTVEGNVFGEFQASWTIKTLFVGFEKE